MALEFAKTGPARYISHLDLQRAFSRAIRRSGLPVKLSEGFNPHYVVSFASALAVGMESVAECVEMVLSQDVALDEFLLRIAKVLPPGLEARRAVRLPQNAPKLMAALRFAEYTVEVNGDREAISRAVQSMLAETQVMVDKTAKGVTKRVDIRGMIGDISWRDDKLVLRLASAQDGTLRPELVMDELCHRAGRFSWRAVRTALLADGPNGPMDLLDRCRNVNDTGRKSR
jgi:radical SAM-linked protein